MAKISRIEPKKKRLQDRIVAKQAQREMMQNLVDTLEGMPDAVDSFDEGAWYALVDHADAHGVWAGAFLFIGYPALKMV